MIGYLVIDSIYQKILLGCLENLKIPPFFAPALNEKHTVNKVKR
jgi:hypothetical protein